MLGGQTSQGSYQALNKTMTQQPFPLSVPSGSSPNDSGSIFKGNVVKPPGSSQWKGKFYTSEDFDAPLTPDEFFGVF